MSSDEEHCIKSESVTSDFCIKSEPASGVFCIKSEVRLIDFCIKSGFDFSGLFIFPEAEEP